MNGSEDGFGLGRRALGGRRSARMNLRPSMINDSANGDGGECTIMLLYVCIHKVNNQELQCIVLK